MDIILIYFATKYNGNWDKIYEALDKKEKPDLKLIKELEMRIKVSKLKIITIIDKDYPIELKKAYKPPFVIWFKGDINKLKAKIICITGNNNDEITNQRINENIPNLNEHYEIMLPGFSGVDKAIEKVYKKPFIRVLANGIDESIATKDILISEFPPETTHPKKEFFRQRNRIIAALSRQIVLFSSNANGGMNHLVNCFLNLGKEVSCFPGDGTKNDGNSELIKQGANLITDILEIN